MLSKKSVSITVLSYFLFGLFVFLEYGEFVVPVPYNPLVVFLIVSTTFLANWKALSRPHYLLLIFATIGFLLHPFLWEITLNQAQQIQLFSSLIIDVLRGIQILTLVLFFVTVSYDKDANKLKIEWLLPAIMVVGCFFNPPMWYFSLIFIVAGLSAFYTLRRRTTTPDFLMDVLIGIGIIYLVSIFY